MRVSEASVLLSSMAGASYAWSQRANRSAAVYLQTNAVEGNAVVALPILADGKLGSGSVYKTGGKGGNHVDPMTMQAVSPDALLSQSAVAVADNYLFAVNAMSNSATMFRIDRNNATDLTLLNSIPIAGDFPNTIAASAKHRLVCVATTGKTNGISCAKYESDCINPFDTLRSLGLNQTIPPTGPPNTVSQVAFTEDEMALVVTVKAGPTTKKPGFVAVYPVEGKKLARAPVLSQPANTAILFGFNQIPHTSNFIVTDPSLGAAILSLDPSSLTVTTSKLVNITGQRATCWSVISPATGTAFVADGAVNRLVEIDVSSGKILSTTDLMVDGDPGLFDMTASGEFLYALSPATSAVTVFKTKSKEIHQHVSLASLGVGANAQGMDVFGGGL